VASPDQDWTECHVVFNSQDYTDVFLQIFSTNATSGTVWIDDVSVENAGLLNLIRRAGAPLLVQPGEGFGQFVEGVDFEPVSDPLLGMADGLAGRYDQHHERPVLKLTGDSPIISGDTLRVSYYHSMLNYDNRPCPAFAEPALLDYLESVLLKVNQELDPSAVFINSHNVSVAGWSEPGYSLNQNGGQCFGQFTEGLDSLVSGIDPAWQVVNLEEAYLSGANGSAVLANHGMFESRYSLPSDWVQVPYYIASDIGGRNLMDTIAEAGNPQLIAFQSWNRSKSNVDDFISYLNHYAINDIAGVQGVCYDTYTADYSRLAEMADIVQDWATYGAD
jgi:hypothetical protein